MKINVGTFDKNEMPLAILWVGDVKADVFLSHRLFTTDR